MRRPVAALSVRHHGRSHALRVLDRIPWRRARPPHPRRGATYRPPRILTVGGRPRAQRGSRATRELRVRALPRRAGPVRAERRLGSVRDVARRQRPRRGVVQALPQSGRARRSPLARRGRRSVEAPRACGCARRPPGPARRARRDQVLLARPRARGIGQDQDLLLAPERDDRRRRADLVSIAFLRTRRGHVVLSCSRRYLRPVREATAPDVSRIRRGQPETRRRRAALSGSLLRVERARGRAAHIGARRRGPSSDLRGPRRRLHRWGRLRPARSANVRVVQNHRGQRDFTVYLSPHAYGSSRAEA